MRWAVFVRSLTGTRDRLLGAYRTRDRLRGKREVSAIGYWPVINACARYRDQLLMRVHGAATSY